MVFYCTDNDRKNIDAYLARAFEAHASGQMTTGRAVIIIRCLIAAAMEDASTEFRSCILPPLEFRASDVSAGPKGLDHRMKPRLVR